MPNPTDYSEMTYNKGTHRYVPNKLAIQKAIATDLETLSHMFDGTGESLSAEIDAWLEEISQIIYDWIYSEAPIDNHSYIEYMFAYDHNCQKNLWQAFIHQAKYDIFSGGSLTGYQHGVNIERAKYIPMDKLRGRITIADGAEKSLRRTGLLTAISLPYTIPSKVYRVDY